MNMRRVVPAVMRLMTLVVLVISGIYFVVYLYRWEWNRAQVSGLMFVGAEVAVVGSHVLRRLRALEGRIDEVERASPPRSPTSATDDGPVAPESPRYPWMRVDRTGVFIPVLLGAGAIVAGLAFVVEKVAAFVMGDARTPSGRLARVAYPGGGLLADTPSTISSRRPRAARLVGAVLGVAVTGAVLVAGVTMLAYYTKSRPDPSERPGTTQVVLHIGYRIGDEIPPEDTATALVESCRLRLPEKAHLVAPPERLGSRTVVLEVEPALGDLGQRRLRGCLEDYTLDGVLVEVRSIRHLS